MLLYRAIVNYDTQSFGIVLIAKYFRRKVSR